MDERKIRLGPRIYRQHRPWRVILAILIVLAVLALVGFVALYILCSRNLVYTTRGVRVVFSPETPRRTFADRNIGSISYLPAVFGGFCAAEAIEVLGGFSENSAR